MKKENIKPTVNGGKMAKFILKNHIEYCTKKDREINEKYNKLIKDINEEKLNPHPDSKKQNNTKWN